MVCGALEAALDSPNWLFAPVWSLLYVAIAFAGWRVWRSGGRTGLVRCSGGRSVALNAVWSWLFFGLHLPGIAFLDLCLLVVGIIGFMASAWRERLASWLFAPYLLWVLFAGRSIGPLRSPTETVTAAAAGRFVHYLYNNFLRILPYFCRCVQFLYRLI